VAADAFAIIDDKGVILTGGCCGWIVHRCYPVLGVQ
jgi:hypothetical protein